MLNLSRIQVANCLALSAALQMQYCPVQAADSAFDQTFSSGISAMQQGKLSQAEKFLKDSLKLEDKDGASEIKRAQSTMVLADIYKSEKRFPESESLYKQLISKFENKPGDQLPAIMNKLAGLYRAEGKYDEALGLYKKSLAVVEKQDGADSSSAATVHANLGLLYQRMQKLKDAEAEEQLAIKIFKAKSGADSIEVAACMRDLAPRFLIENKTKQGIDYLEQAVAIFAKKLPDSLEYANCAEQLGGAYYSIGRYGDAEDLSRKALAIYEKRSGPNSPDVAIALTNLGGRLEKESKNKEAIDAYHKSLAIMDKAAAANTDKSNDLTSNISKNLIGLAEVYIDQTDYKRAENVLRKDLAIREKRWGPKHPALIPALRNLSNCLIIQGTAQEESDMLRTREQEILGQIPMGKRKAINEFIQHEIIKSLDLGTKKERKKSDMW